MKEKHLTLLKRDLMVHPVDAKNIAKTNRDQLFIASSWNEHLRATQNAVLWQTFESFLPSFIVETNGKLNEASSHKAHPIKF